MVRVGRFVIREIGDPLLRKVAKPVDDPKGPLARKEGARLKRALKAFRAHYGFGRAIAAPQIGISKRMLALDLGRGPFLMMNPEISWVSKRTFSMWDDCMSFPGLMVRLRRHDSVSVRYFDERGRRRQVRRAPRALAELLQHELDHLDGVLAVDRTHRRRAVVSRGEYLRGRARLDAKVDYAIEPTIPGPLKASARAPSRRARRGRSARRRRGRRAA